MGPCCETKPRSKRSQAPPRCSNSRGIGMNGRSIKGDRLQLANPTNFIHGELSQAGRQWAPLRLIVRMGEKDRLAPGERQRGRANDVVRYRRKIVRLLFGVITYCALAPRVGFYCYSAIGVPCRTQMGTKCLGRSAKSRHRASRKFHRNERWL